MTKLTVEEGENLIISILRQKGAKVTTWDLDREVKGKDHQCPDEIVRFLAKMRARGKIKGEISRELRGWVWWVE